MNIQPGGHSTEVDRIARVANLSSQRANGTKSVGRGHESSGAEDVASPIAPPRHNRVLRDPPQDDDDKVPGVIRLIEGGHFKGVADVRLRINFFGELSGRAALAAQPVIQEQADELVEAVRGGVEELIATLFPGEEARAAIGGLVGEFEAAVGEAVDGMLSDGAVNADELGDAVRSVFGMLVDGLKELLGPPIEEEAGVADSAAPLLGEQRLDVPEAPIDGPVDSGVPPGDETIDPPTIDPGDEPAEEPTVSFEDALASLRATFDQALTEVLSSIGTATRLGDPSPPRGNGGAYDKFLALYDALRGLPAGLDESA